MKQVEYKFSVEWGDTDAAGIVFYPNFYRWMDQATHRFLAYIGYPSSSLFYSEKIGVPLLESTCKFKTPLFFEDEVTIETTITEIKDKVFYFQHIFKRKNVTIAIGNEIRAWTSFKGEKPKAISIPDELCQVIVDSHLQQK